MLRVDGAAVRKMCTGSVNCGLLVASSVLLLYAKRAHRPGPRRRARLYPVTEKHPGSIHPGDPSIASFWYRSAVVCRCGDWFTAVTRFMFLGQRLTCRALKGEKNPLRHISESRTPARTDFGFERITPGAKIWILLDAWKQSLHFPTGHLYCWCPIQELPVSDTSVITTTQASDVFLGYSLYFTLVWKSSSPRSHSALQKRDIFDSILYPQLIRCGRSNLLHHVFHWSRDCDPFFSEGCFWAPGSREQQPGSGSGPPPRPGASAADLRGDESRGVPPLRLPLPVTHRCRGNPLKVCPNGLMFSQHNNFNCK